jgi:hypothetical protein
MNFVFLVMLALVMKKMSLKELSNYQVVGREG